MLMGRDAQGFLFNIVPVALRIPIFVVNIDTKNRGRNGAAIYNIQEMAAQHPELSLWMNDSLNFHNQHPIYVLRKDGHYDALFKASDLIALHPNYKINMFENLQSDFKDSCDNFVNDSGEN